MTSELLTSIDHYIEGLFGGDDLALRQNLADSEAAGLPPINVSANQGRLLYLLATLSRARRILEIGTLGGYSTTWLARALPPDGTITTLELNAHHAAVARRNLDTAGVGDRVTIEVGPAAESLRQLIVAGAAPFDFIFIDADKPGYPAYLDLALKLATPGTVIIADNLIRNGAVLDDQPADENARAVKTFNAKLAANPALDSVILPIMRETVDGMSISIVR